MASIKEILVHTDSDRILKFLRQYWNLGFSISHNEKRYLVTVIYLNDCVYQKVQQIYQYPVFLFYVNDETDYAFQLPQQLTQPKKGAANSKREHSGTLEIIDTQVGQCLLKYSYEDTIFQKIEKKIHDEISTLWKFEIQKEIIETAKPKKVISDDPARIGKFIRTINYPTRIQPGEEISVTESHRPKDLPVTVTQEIKNGNSIKPECEIRKKKPKIDALERVAVALFFIEIGDTPTIRAAEKKFYTNAKTIRDLKGDPEVLKMLDEFRKDRTSAYRLREKITRNNKSDKS